MTGLTSAQQTLPYTARKLSFSGLSTSVQGDLRTVGMGGATVGLADTFIAAIDNPAGLAMTVGVGDIHYATTSIHDGHVQRFDTAPDTNSVGLALGLYPWAVSFGYLSRYREDATYSLPSLAIKPIQLSVTTREFVLSAARVFAHDRLSLGVAVILGQAVRELDSGALKIDRSYASYTGGVSLGITGQLPRRLLLGISFSSPLHYSAASASEQKTLPVPGFFQSVEVPWRVSLGLGFVPNRFFRADLTVHLFTATPHTALVRDETALVGQSITLQPRLGIAYVFADYKEFKSTLFAGTYFESSRIATAGNRPHGTAAVEARIWIFTFGGGVDFADDYENYLFSIGVDVFGVLARLHVIPVFWTPPSNRMFPHPFKFSDAGLARPLVAHYVATSHDVDPIKVALAIPKKLGEGLHNAKVELEKIGNDLATGIEASNETKEQKAERERLAEEARKAEEAKVLADAKAADDAKRVEAKRRRRRHKRHATSTTKSPAHGSIPAPTTP